MQWLLGPHGDAVEAPVVTGRAARGDDRGAGVTRPSTRCDREFGIGRPPGPEGEISDAYRYVWYVRMQ